ncbi:MAG: hypothetical protein KG003_06660 [Bacteroidetes bacterium]|nr:hypothetical protein [Bacteroidota bacterium]
MHKSILVFGLIFISVFNVCSGQIGAKRSVIEAYLGKKQIFSEHVEGDYFTQEFRTGKQEITQIMYNKDSIAVALTIGTLDSSITDILIADYLKNNFSGFAAHKIGANGVETYYLDTVKTALMMVKHTSLKAKSPIVSFSLCNDPDLINFWMTGVEWFKPE